MKKVLSLLSILVLSFAMFSCGATELTYAIERAEKNIKTIKKNLNRPITDTRSIPNAVKETAEIKQKLKIFDKQEISDIHTLQAEALYNFADEEVDSGLADRIKMYAREVEKEAKAVLER